MGQGSFPLATARSIGPGRVTASGLKAVKTGGPLLVLLAPGWGPGWARCRLPEPGCPSSFSRLLLAGFVSGGIGGSDMSHVVFCRCWAVFGQAREGWLILGLVADQEHSGPPGWGWHGVVPLPEEEGYFWQTYGVTG